MARDMAPPTNNPINGENHSVAGSGIQYELNGRAGTDALT